LFNLHRWVSRRRSTSPYRKSTHLLSVERLEERTTPTIFSPTQIRHAYGFDQPVNGTQLTGAGQTIVIVDAYYDSTAASDLAAFDSRYGVAAITNNPLGTIGGGSSGPTFSQISQTGGNPNTYTQNSGWAGETALDIEWAHAIAPGANIVLVEGKNSSSLNTAVNYARTLAGVSVISMSWGGGESSGESSDTTFTTPSNHTGISFFAASGDTGGQVIYPAASQNVVAVGGTSLTLNGDNSYNSELAWSGGGGGASAFVSTPSYQQIIDPSTGLPVYSGSKRGTPDVSYDSDPNTGFAVINNGSLEQVGGTSDAAPQWAALVALADQGRALAGWSTSTVNLRSDNNSTSQSATQAPTQLLTALYSLPDGDFHDVTSGSNGYSATTGYDLATGRGSPKAQLVIAGLIAYGATAPSITTSLQPNTTADAGTQVTFTAAASVNPTPTVQWQISTNGGATWTNIGGATSTTYTRTLAVGDNGAEIKAVLTNLAGSASTQTTLTVQSTAPTMTQQPVSQLVIAGQPVTFTAAASGSPAPSIQWQVSTDGGNTWTNINGAYSTSYTFTPTAADNGKLFQAVFTNGAGSTNSTAATLTVDVPATIASLQVNDGSAQRSMVQSITVTFSGQVSFANGNAAAAFQLLHLTNGNAVLLSAAVSTNASGQTVVTLTFSGGETDPATAGLAMPSLADGVYQLTVLSGNVTDANGITLDGNGDGTPGDNYVSAADSAGGTGPRLYRLFGDVNGDGVVNALDYGQFRLAYGYGTGDPAYLAAFDADGSGAINAFDFGQFRNRYGINLFPS
jgi:hypothetical protein